MFCTANTRTQTLEVYLRTPSLAGLNAEVVSRLNHRARTERCNYIRVSQWGGSELLPRWRVRALRSDVA